MSTKTESAPAVPVPHVTVSVPMFSDFTVQNGTGIPSRVVLEWRGSSHPFWMIHLPETGIFRPAIEVDIRQARAIADALAEYDRRAAEGTTK